MAQLGLPCFCQGQQTCRWPRPRSQNVTNEESARRSLEQRLVGWQTPYSASDVRHDCEQMSHSASEGGILGFSGSAPATGHMRTGPVFSALYSIPADTDQPPHALAER